MDLRTQQLNKASFSIGSNSIEFLVEAESSSNEGRKVAIIDYPNSNKRNVQDLGKAVPDHEVTAIVHGDDFLEQEKEFRRILDIGGEGKLVLPHRGTLDVVALPYSVDYSHKRVGVVKFKLKFTRKNADEVPAQAAVSLEDLYNATFEARIKNEEVITDNYTIPEDEFSIIKAGNDLRESVLNTVSSASSDVNTFNSKVQNVVREVQSDLIAIVLDPQKLAKKLIYGNIANANGLFATISSLYSETSNNVKLVNSSLSQTVFGIDFSDNGASKGEMGVVYWPNDTEERQTKNTNRALIVETTRINSLLLGFESAARYNYKTTLEIDQAIESLETAYTSVMLTTDENSIAAQDNDFKLLIDNCKSICYDVLNDKAQQVFSISTYESRSVQSIMNFTYKLYAERLKDPSDLEEISETMVSINPSQNPCTLKGDITVFEVT
jgi:hypothetical protein